jgi:hypothetical protein
LADQTLWQLGAGQTWLETIFLTLYTTPIETFHEHHLALQTAKNCQATLMVVKRTRYPVSVYRTIAKRCIKGIEDNIDDASGSPKGEEWLTILARELQEITDMIVKEEQ